MQTTEVQTALSIAKPGFMYAHSEYVDPTRERVTVCMSPVVDAEYPPYQEVMEYLLRGAGDPQLLMFEELDSDHMMRGKVLTEVWELQHIN